jgi:hypothetical protein
MNKLGIYVKSTLGRVKAKIFGASLLKLSKKWVTIMRLTLLFRRQ